MTAAAPLTELDVDRAFSFAVPSWLVERLDTRLGTVDVVKLIRNGGCGCHGVVTHEGDLPYGGPKPGRPTFCFKLDRTSKGFDVNVIRHEAGDVDVMLRSGSIPWNRLANMATIRALELRHETRDPLVGEQLTIGGLS
jgi:hypothetical protein